MSEKIKPTEALKDIKEMMEKSSKFLSLSGLSGIFAGAIALMGAYFAHEEIVKFTNQYGYQAGAVGEADLRLNLIKLALIVLVVALSGAILFSYRQSQRDELPFWDKSAKRLLVNLSIPLITGGIFIATLLFKYHNAYPLIAASTLIFYGLALINASNYTINGIKTLGILQIILGVLCLMLDDFHIYIWAFGFGILHIIYGVKMHFNHQQGA